MEFSEVTTNGLTKLFGATRALSDVSLRFAAGEVTAIEGPNGSGKSTLLSILSLTARPTRGTVRFGKVPAERLPTETRRSIGLLSHLSMLYPDLSGRENLEFFAHLFLKGASGATVAERLSLLTARFELGPFLERPTATYSRGQLQRVALARSLLHAPRLLLLDEPSTGLDTKAKGILWQTVAEEKARGCIVVVVTHDPECAARIATQRVTLSRGRVDRTTAVGSGASA